jgi:hypothetical protein
MGVLMTLNHRVSTLQCLQFKCANIFSFMKHKLRHFATPVWYNVVITELTFLASWLFGSWPFFQISKTFTLMSKKCFWTCQNGLNNKQSLKFCHLKVSFYLFRAALYKLGFVLHKKALFRCRLYSTAYSHIFYQCNHI